MTHVTHQENSNDSTLSSACKQGSCTGASQSKSSASAHCAGGSKQGMPIKEEVVDITEEWDY